MIGSNLARGIPVATADDLRRYPRFNPPKPTFSAWQSANERFVSRVGNLGLGGLFIRTSESPPPGTSLQLLLDTVERKIRARGEVKSAKPKEGMGVKIVATQQEDRARFVRWIKKLSTCPNPARNARWAQRLPDISARPVPY
jgi:PilZ domain